MLKKPRDKHLGLLFDSEMHYKIKYIADYNGRSLSGHVLYLIRQNIQSFEKKHGEIEFPPKEEREG